MQDAGEYEMDDIVELDDFEMPPLSFRWKANLSKAKRNIITTKQSGEE